MARTVTAGGLLVKKSEFTRIRIDDESAHGPALFTGEIAGFIRRIKKPLVWMNGEETRADRFGGQLRSAQPAADRIEAGDINPFALPAGVSAEVNEEFFRVARRRCRFGVLKGETAKKAGERACNYCSDRETGYPNSESGFPLTPARSLGERENPDSESGPPHDHTRAGVCPTTTGKSPTRSQVFPLPEGEG